ncbi:hypothetical protein LOZ58_004817 [Ophidiomyces ophidiicola]|nr:hypothetical protein LOZ58_004817 [Ophidiomyces ophidiicola]
MEADRLSQESSQSSVMEASAGGGADKKRNKLGYHRTSVACVHCRRRKIRCLLAPEDPQGRCENCIRLKKECHFYPVDQQPPMEKRGRAGSRADASASDASMVTTPTLLGSGPIVEQKESYFPYPGIPVNATPELVAFNSGAYGAVTMSPYSPDMTVSHGLNPMQPMAQPTTWGASLYDQQPPVVPSTVQSSPAGAGAMWDRGIPLSAPMAPLSTIGAPANPAGLVSSGLAGNNAFNMMPDNPPWSLQSSATMPMSSPESTSSGYAGSIHAPLSSEYKPQINPSNRAYSLPIISPVSGLPHSAIPVSFDGQHQPLAYHTWSAMSGPDMSTGQTVIPGLPDSMAGWYAGDPAQYAHMKQEAPIVTTPLHPFDSGTPHPMQNP